MRNARLRPLVAALMMAAAPPLLAQDDLLADPELEAMLGMSLVELMEQSVFLASGTMQSMADAPAATVVLTAQEIAQRGYTHLAEVLADLPGFDLSVANGTSYATAYQRGYRTLFTQRTLLMIDGKVDNHLWSHAAQFSRQYPMSDVERIEVLYGPASAIYGANAFLGIINVVTAGGEADEEDGQLTTVNVQAGSFESVGLDAATRGKVGEVGFALAARVFRSDEPDLSDRWGYNTHEVYAGREIWGPLLDLEVNGKALGTYEDPTDDYGLRGRLEYGGLELAFQRWKTREGYGPYYPADRAQSNVFWENASTQVSAAYDGQLADDIRGASLLVYRRSFIGGWWAANVASGIVQVAGTMAGA